MKVATAIAELLRDSGITTAFVISGGASLHLIHGIDETDGISYVCPQTEQSAGYAADAYARVTGLGCAIATSGPGATNLITPLAASYYDSIPVIYITGQVTRARMTNGSGVRQTGFQETPIVRMVKPVTKHAETVMQAEFVLPAIRNAIGIARSGRKGPVLIDIPDDIQRADI